MLFEAVTSNDSIHIKISKYVPFFCTAIHAGSKFRQELKEKVALDGFERWYEEDPHTGEFIASMPITIICNDSRYEYDLNRKPEDCIYHEAWGKKIWKRKLSVKDIKHSKQKHANYYKLLHCLLTKIESLYGGCLVYDIHSYNYKRWEKDVPLFNVGTENIDNARYSDVIENWLGELRKIEISSIDNSTATNDVFYGRGYNLQYITEHFPNSLVLATEIKKIYCDELTGDAYPYIIRKLQHQLKIAILNNANFFSQKLDGWKHYTTVKLLDKDLDKDLLTLDATLHRILKGFELLAAVNPTNVAVEKKLFFKNRDSELPKFRYNPIKINAYELKQELFSLPVNRIQDVSIRYLYESVITSYFDKIDMIGSLGTRKFMYNSLRYFGRPSAKDLKNAHYLLHLPTVPGEAQTGPALSVDDAVTVFKKALDDYGIIAKIEVSNKVISQVMVLNSKRKIVFNKDAVFRKRELTALIEHEIGVHICTTMNSNLQKLKVFNLGLPINTMTQEGLAILAEYLSGYLTIGRLKRLALRVIAVDAMCSGASFIECFQLLCNTYRIDQELAFSITTRVYRGGGFTKDYLYLSGFVKVFKYWQNQNDLSPLFVGKTSLEFYPIIEELIGREMVSKPTYIARSFQENHIDNDNSIYNYIISGLQ